MQSAIIMREFYTKFADWDYDASTIVEETAEETTEGTRTSKGKGHETTAVEELPLPTRTINALKKQGIESLEDLGNKSDDELSDIKNLGEKSLEEIKSLLEKEGLR